MLIWGGVHCIDAAFLNANAVCGRFLHALRLHLLKAVPYVLIWYMRVLSNYTNSLCQCMRISTCSFYIIYYYIIDESMHVTSVYKSVLLIITAALPHCPFLHYSGQSVLVQSLIMINHAHRVDHHVSLSKVSTIATLYAFLWDVPWWETYGFGWVDWKSSVSSRPQIWSFQASTVSGCISCGLMSQQVPTNGDVCSSEPICRMQFPSISLRVRVSIGTQTGSHGQRNKIQSWLICAGMLQWESIKFYCNIASSGRSW